MPYSTTDDLLLAHVTISGGVDKERFVASAAEEIDGKLGFAGYSLPLAMPNTVPGPTSWTGLPLHEQYLLKGINNKLASGRLIMAIATASEDMSVHAYGASLVREATQELLLIANAEVLLSAARRTSTPDSAATRAPMIGQKDSESLVDGFEKSVMGGVPWWSRPGY